MLDFLETNPNRGLPDDTRTQLSRLFEKHQDLVQRYRLMKKGLDRAARVQQSLLPARAPAVAGYDFAYLYRPCEDVGGDFYDYVESEDGLILIISDVIGHGFEAALTTMLMKELFQEVAAPTAEPVDVLKAMNGRLHRALPEGMFAAAAIVKLAEDLPEVQYANAGLPYPFVIRSSDRRVQEVELAGFPLVLFDGDAAPSYEARSLSLTPEDVLLVGSDGIHAVAGTAGDSFDDDRLTRLFDELMGRSGIEILDGLLEEFCIDDGEPLPDDVNLLAITRVSV
ncbi:MAG TPA: PP2C family protein-serine/threonine phosphatase [Vicinamibacteria bacterium]|nr:PP2C family protein-serine/threonine phosphatase [Vicinamibacteria bacterium]